MAAKGKFSCFVKKRVSYRSLFQVQSPSGPYENSLFWHLPCRGVGTKTGRKTDVSVT